MEDLLAELERRRNAGEGVCPAARAPESVTVTFAWNVSVKRSYFPAEYDSLLQDADSFFEQDQ